MERYKDIEIDKMFKKYKVVSIINWCEKLEKRVRKLEKNIKIGNSK